MTFFVYYWLCLAAIVFSMGNSSVNKETILSGTHSEDSVALLLS